MPQVPKRLSYSFVIGLALFVVCLIFFRMRLPGPAALKEEEIRFSYSLMQKTPKSAIDSSRSTF